MRGIWSKILCFFGRHDFIVGGFVIKGKFDSVAAINVLVCNNCRRMDDYIPELDVSNKMLNACNIVSKDMHDWTSMDPRYSLIVGEIERK